MSDTQLINRILSLIQSGYRRSTIIEHLVREGYEIDTIEVGFDEVYVSGRAPEEFWEKGVVSPGFSNTAIHGVSDVVDEKEALSFFGKLQRYFIYHKKQVAVWMILGTIVVAGCIIVAVLYMNNPRIVVMNAYEKLLSSPRISFSFNGDIPGHRIELEGDVRNFSSGLFSLNVGRGNTVWSGQILASDGDKVFIQFDRGIAQDAASRWLELEETYPGGEDAMRYLGIYPIFSHMKFLFSLDSVLGDGIFRLLDGPAALSIEEDDARSRLGIRAYRTTLSQEVINSLWLSLIGPGEPFVYEALRQAPWYIYVNDAGEIVRSELISQNYLLSFSFSYPEKAENYTLDVEAIPVSEAAQWVVLQ